MGGGKERYYTGLAREDYYAGAAFSELEPEGVWLGRGAEWLSIEGQTVGQGIFKNLFRGFSPDGAEKWVYNAGQFKGNSRDRMPGYDLTFGLPKSVSIAYAIGSSETRRAIERAARGAITATLSDIEKGCIVRSGKGGKVKESAGIVAGVFQHATARQVDKNTPPDPHVHFHVTVINTGITAKGKTGALQGRDFLNHTFAKEYGAKFRERFESGLNAVGFATEKTKDAFELKGISKEAIEHLSKRTAKIEELAPKGEHSYREQKAINVKSRVAKGEYKTEELERHWKEECLKFGLTPAVVEALRGERKTPAAVSEEKEKAQQTRKSAGDFSQYPDVPQAEQHEPKERRVISHAEALREKEKQDQERWAKAAEAFREIKREYEGQGFKVIGCALSTEATERMTKTGVMSFTASRLLKDFAREGHQAENGKKRPEQTLRQKLTLAPNPTPNQRKIIAAFKEATWQWSKETAKRYTGEYYKPSSKLYHEFLYATHQISRKHKDFLNRELERQDRRIDEKTVLVIDITKMPAISPAIEKLKDDVVARGGRVLLVDAHTLKSKETAREAMRQREAEERFREREQARVRGL